MEIWDWVWDAEEALREKGNHRLADIMDNISTWTCADEHNKVDQVYPEALALAKKESNRWIEVFIRHWYLQSQVLHRHNVKDMVREAVELLELSSQDDTKNCPQSVCAVQDLANTYAQKDGPSYVEERISVSQESLAKINPAWPCFECISDEYISALIDSDKLEEALSEIKTRRKQILAAERTHKTNAFCLTETEILITQKKYDEAEKIIRKAENLGGGESFLRYKSALTAIVLAYQGRFEEAEEFVLPFKEVLKAQSHFLYWAEYMYLAAKHNSELNDDDLNYCFNTMVNRFIENGVQRDSLQLMDWQIELAFARTDLFSIERIIEKSAAIIKELRKDFGATEWLQTQRDKFEQMKTEFENSSNDLLERVSASETDEDSDAYLDALGNLNLTQLSFIAKHQSDDLRIQLVYTDKLEDNGFSDLALDVMQRLIDAEVYYPLLLSRYGNSLLDKNELAKFDRFFTEQLLDSFDEAQKIYALWVISRRYVDEDVDKAIEVLEAIVAIDDELENTLRKLAELSAKQGNYARAVECWSKVIALDPEENEHFHWDRMVSATLNENWESVRESCEVLEIQLDSESGPIDENFGSIRIQTEDRSGERINLNALRTGPVSARITEMFLDEDEQFYGDEVVFEATPLNRLDSKDDDGDACDSEGYYTLLYPIYKTQKKGSCYIFDFDGIHPGEEKWNSIIEVFTQNDCDISVRTSSSYQVCDNETDEYLDAIYCYIAAASTTNLDKLNKDLFKVVKDLEYPFVWGRLASKVGDVALLELQAKHEERFGLG